MRWPDIRRLWRRPPRADPPQAALVRPDLSDWAGPDADRAARVTDDAVARLARCRDPAAAMDILRAALPPPATRARLRAALHLRDGADPAARQVGRLAVAEHASLCQDFRRAAEALETLLADPAVPGPQIVRLALMRLLQARWRLGQEEAALALLDRPEAKLSTRARRLLRVRLTRAADPEGAMAILAEMRAPEGRTRRMGAALHLAGLLDAGDLAGARAAAERLVSQPDCAGLARLHLSNLAIEIDGDPSGMPAALDALGVTATTAGGFDDIRVEPRRRDDDDDDGDGDGDTGATAAAPPLASAPPLVSVVVTAFDAEAHLGTALRSILEQTRPHLELIVVDDRSSDGTWARLGAIAAADPRVRPLRMPVNGGTYRAKNRGIAAAKGAYIALCDADDMWTPDHLARHLRAMVRAPEVAMSTSNWLRVHQDGRIEIKPHGAAVERCPHSTFFRRDVFDRVGLFDAVRFGADREMLNRVALEYGPAGVAHLGEVLTLGRRHDGSLTTSGEGAIRARRASDIRQTYRNIWTGWHMEEVARGRPLHNSGRPEDRPYDVPETML